MLIIGKTEYRVYGNSLSSQFFYNSKKNCLLKNSNDSHPQVRWDLTKSGWAREFNKIN